MEEVPEEIWIPPAELPDDRCLLDGILALWECLAGYLTSILLHDADHVTVKLKKKESCVKINQTKIENEKRRAISRSSPRRKYSRIDDHKTNSENGLTRRGCAKFFPWVTAVTHEFGSRGS